MGLMARHGGTTQPQLAAESRMESRSSERLSTTHGDSNPAILDLQHITAGESIPPHPPANCVDCAVSDIQQT